jgi:hypothetical protein
MELANELRTAWAESDFGDGLKQPVADAWEGSDRLTRLRSQETTPTRKVPSGVSYHGLQAIRAESANTNARGDAVARLWDSFQPKGRRPPDPGVANMPFIPQGYQALAC